MISPEYLYMAAATAPAVLLVGIATWALFRQKKQGIEPPTPPNEPVTAEPAAPFVPRANPMTVNPTSEQEIAFAYYRADAIARDNEQRRDEGRPKHPEYEQLKAEAMTYAWMLVRAGRYTEDHVRALGERLKWR